MLHHAFLKHLEERFTAFFDNATQIVNCINVPGGDINQACKLETDKGAFLIKINAALFGLDFFEKEARGLLTLADTQTLKIPRPLFDGKFHQQVFLVMEYLERDNPSPDFWEDFASNLARLHHQTQDQFGLQTDNYIGRLPQVNSPLADWPSFYGQQRIMKLVNKAVSKQLLSVAEGKMAESLVAKLSQLFPAEKPHLLHGDLWNGNFMCTSGGHAAVFDPAIYYGNREMDIAMTILFGGFDHVFYEAYNHAYPLEPGWRERVPLCQLYPLLVHLTLFGGHYHASVTDILKKYGG